MENGKRQRALQCHEEKECTDGKMKLQDWGSMLYNIVILKQLT